MSWHRQPGVDCLSFDMVDDANHNLKSDFESSRGRLVRKSLTVDQTMCCSDIWILLNRSYNSCLGAEHPGRSIRAHTNQLCPRELFFLEEVGHCVYDIFCLCSCYQWPAEEELLLRVIFQDGPSINQKLWKLCDVCDLISLDGEEGRGSDFFLSPEVSCPGICCRCAALLCYLRDLSD